MLMNSATNYLHDNSVVFSFPGSFLDGRMGHHRVQGALFESIILGVDSWIGKAHQHIAYPAVIVVHERSVEDWVRDAHS